MVLNHNIRLSFKNYWVHFLIFCPTIKCIIQNNFILLLKLYFSINCMNNLIYRSNMKMVFKLDIEKSVGKKRKKRKRYAIYHLFCLKNKYSRLPKIYKFLKFTHHSKYKKWNFQFRCRNKITFFNIVVKQLCCKKQWSEIHTISYFKVCKFGRVYYINKYFFENAWKLISKTNNLCSKISAVECGRTVVLRWNIIYLFSLQNTN